jgi:hypothetical protein
MSAVQARIHFSLKQELKLLKHIIAEDTPEEYDYEPSEGSRKAKKSDYDNCDVIPVSDPNASTMAQKIVQYQAVLQLAQSAPQMYNMPLLHRQMLDVLGIKNASKLIPMPEDQKPQDPVTENQSVLMMKPVKAFAYQDHQAHITVHMTAMQDPKIMQLLQNNPQAQQLQAAMMAHINEHLGFEYRVQVEQQLGFTLPPQKDESGEDAEIDINLEAKLAPLLAQAAQRLLQQNQAQTAQQQAQQMAKDPIVQMQQQELQLKVAEQKRKTDKDVADMALEKEKLDLERKRIGAQTAMDTLKAKANMEENKLKMGVDLVNKIADQHHENNAQKRDNALQILKHENPQSKGER